MLSPREIGAIFDCDGTLIDSMGVWRELENSIAIRAGRELTDAERDAIAPMTIPECGVFFHEELGVFESPEAVVDYIDEFMYDYYAHRAKLRPGARAFLEGLASYGVPMAVASSTPHALLEAAFESAGVRPLLQAIFSVDDVGVSKREPAIFEAARAALGTEKAHTWGFEDSLYAVRTLKSAGFPAYAVYDCDMSGAYEDLCREADACVRSFNEMDTEAFLRLAGASL